MVVFLDRDGVINRDRPEFVKSWAEFEFLPGVIEALARLTGAGARIIVFSNQSCVGRGICSIEVVNQINQRMSDEMAKAGAHLAGVYICPHAPEDGCDCRKPKPGLILQAAAELELDLEGAVVIGDDLRDLQAGRAAGLAAILVRTGKGAGVEADPAARPDLIADDLSQAVDLLIEEVMPAEGPGP